MGIEQDPECRWDVLRIIFGDGFRDMFLIFFKNAIFDVSYIFTQFRPKNSKIQIGYIGGSILECYIWC